MYAEKTPINEHNESKLDQSERTVVLIPATDDIPKDLELTTSDLEDLKNVKLCDTGNLAGLLHLEIGAPVNVKTDDRLVNSSVGQIMQFRYSNNQIKTVYVKFEDPRGEKKPMEKILLQEP